MLGTPIRLPAARDLYSAGLKIVSTDRYGKADNTDRLGHAPAGIAHAKRGWEPHTAAGGPVGAPVYVSIDDDPSHDQDKQLVAPYLRARKPVLGHRREGVYANSKTIDSGGAGRHRVVLPAAQPRRARGVHHPAAQLHQVGIATREVAGLGEILQPQFGEWY
ncbi:MAG TPA: DUF1906 domain-containing protein [Mycobacterium sp.]|nr:DUF1906 domain-containing protein [Mycobacterium sp.]